MNVSPKDKYSTINLLVIDLANVLDCDEDKALSLAIESLRDYLNDEIITKLSTTSNCTDIANLLQYYRK